VEVHGVRRVAYPAETLPAAEIVDAVHG
jgi:hypothetical protein